MNDKHDTDRIEVVNTKTERWVCAGCRSLLGFVENKKIIRMKRRDLYVTIDLGAEGKIETPCWRCGKMNVLRDDGEDSK